MSTAIASPAQPQIANSAASSKPRGYEFSVKGANGKWLDWYPLAVESDAEAEATVRFWGGCWRRTPLHASLEAPINSARAAALQETVPRWRSRLDDGLAEANPNESWADERRALIGEVRDLRALINKLVEHVDAPPNDFARSMTWAESLQRAAMRCRAAGDAGDTETLSDIVFFLRAGRKLRQPVAPSGTTQIDWFPVKKTDHTHHAARDNKCENAGT